MCQLPSKTITSPKGRTIVLGGFWAYPSAMLVRQYASPTGEPIKMPIGEALDAICDGEAYEPIKVYWDSTPEFLPNQKPEDNWSWAAAHTQYARAYYPKDGDTHKPEREEVVCIGGTRGARVAAIRCEANPYAEMGYNRK